MLRLDRLKTSEFREISEACALLFARSEINNVFLSCLNLKMVKNAYRSLAKALHPDMQRGISKGSSERFIMVTDAYKILIFYLQNEVFKETRREEGQGTLIAVGGAKGGIGKSVFSTNLAVLLSKRGYDTIVVDLDLGNSNLHLYLGETTVLKRSINDFINKRVESLDDVMIRSRFGPRFIGGNSSELGSANIHFSKKLRLLRAIRTLKADYIVLDLGGDTAYNILDFFLAADYGVVMTTPESASYIGAYHFIKAALYRKLNRLFGPESRYMAQRDRQLELFIQEATMSNGATQVKTIDQLKERAWGVKPGYQGHINKAIAEFKPYLVINKTPPDYAVKDLVDKLRGVTKRWLSKEVGYLGNISAQVDVEKSTSGLYPLVARQPNGEYAKQLGRITDNLLRSG